MRKARYVLDDIKKNLINMIESILKMYINFIGEQWILL